MQNIIPFEELRRLHRLYTEAWLEDAARYRGCEPGDPNAHDIRDRMKRQQEVLHLLFQAIEAECK